MVFISMLLLAVTFSCGEVLSELSHQHFCSIRESIMKQKDALQTTSQEQSVISSKIDNQTTLMASQATLISAMSGVLNTQTTLIEELTKQVNDTKVACTQEIQSLKLENTQLLEEVKKLSSTLLEPKLHSENNIEKILSAVQTFENTTNTQIHSLQENIKQVKLDLENKMDCLAIKDKIFDCADLYKSGQRSNGVYEIYQRDMSICIQVYCDMTTSGGGWTVFQKRYDGSVLFNRTWEEYKYGFGNMHGEFWLGNKYVSLLTSFPQTKYRLRVDLKAFDGQTRYAEYTNFKVEPESEKYRLNIGTYSGTAGDGGLGLSYHNTIFFSTRDKDSSKYGICSMQQGSGGFWYDHCEYVNINGVYRPAGYSGGDGIKWRAWLGTQTLQATSMMFRPMNFP